MGTVYSYRWSRPDEDEGGVEFCFVPEGVCPMSYFVGRQDEATEAGLELLNFQPCPRMKYFRVLHKVRWQENGPIHERLWPSYHTSREACAAEWQARVDDPENPIVSFDILDD